MANLQKHCINKTLPIIPCPRIRSKKWFYYLFSYIVLGTLIVINAKVLMILLCGNDATRGVIRGAVHVPGDNVLFKLVGRIRVKQLC